MNYLLAFSTFIVMQLPPLSSSKIFPKGLLPSPLCPVLARISWCAVPVDLPILDILCTLNHTICDLSCLAFFTYRNVFEVHSPRSMYF